MIKAGQYGRKYGMQFHTVLVAAPCCMGLWRCEVITMQCPLHGGTLPNGMPTHEVIMCVENTGLYSTYKEILP